MHKAPLALFAAVGMSLLIATAAGAVGHTIGFQLELGEASVSAVRFSGELPAGAGLVEKGKLDASDPVYGAAFLYQPFPWLGFRIGTFQTDFSLSGSETCTRDPECSFSRDGVTFKLDQGVRGSVDDTSTFRAIFLDVPFFLHAGSRGELFAGPTWTNVHLSGVSSSGPNALTVRARASSSLGLNAGGQILLGFSRRWSVGVIGRWVPTRLHLQVVQPNFGPLLSEPGNLLSVSRDEDLTTVSLLLGRRFH